MECNEHSQLQGGRDSPHPALLNLLPSFYFLLRSPSKREREREMDVMDDDEGIKREKSEDNLAKGWV